MSKTVTETDRVFPSSGQYGSSIFSTIVTGVIITIAFYIVYLFLVGLLNLVAGYSLLNYALDNRLLEVDEEGVPIPFEKTNYNLEAIAYAKYLRLGFAYLILSVVLIFPLRWLSRTYGRQSLKISEEGISIFKWPRNRFDLPWTGILDITVKDSDSVFANLARNQTKITVYTMDRSISIESLTIRNTKEVSSKLKAYGDSLEERVIDFGYGQSIAVIWRRMKRNKIGMLGALLVIFFVSFAILGAVIGIIFPLNSLEAQRTATIFSYNFKLTDGKWTIHNPNFVNFDQINKSPSSEYWFGTDSNGRDIFSRLLFGAFYSILIAVIATTISTVIGAFVGAASGYIGGTLDQMTQRLTEILNAMPGLPILLLISTSITLILDNVKIEGAYYLAVYSIFALIGWGGIARIIRSEVLGLKNSEFIQAEIILGSTHGRIIRKHVMPNAFSTVIIFFTLGVAGNIIGVASLSFLGFGSSSTLVWGKDLSDAIFNQPLTNWWGVTFISLMLFLLVLGFNLLGDTLRDALDPTLKE